MLLLKLSKKLRTKLLMHMMFFLMKKIKVYFYDYLIKNIDLYFDKFETDLEATPGNTPEVLDDSEVELNDPEASADTGGLELDDEIELDDETLTSALGA